MYREATVIVCNKDFCKEFVITNSAESDMVAKLASDNDAVVIMHVTNWGKFILEYVVYSVRLSQLWESIRLPHERQRFEIERVMSS